MSKSSMGIIIGNPRMAIKVPLFEALEAMLEIMVNEVEKPIEASIKLILKSQKSLTGLPNKTI
jgi:hypothetical protein